MCRRVSQGQQVHKCEEDWEEDCGTYRSEAYLRQKKQKSKTATKKKAFCMHAAASGNARDRQEIREANRGEMRDAYG